MAGKSVNLNDYRTKDIDAKFEKVTKADMRKMSGTGMGAAPKKKRTVKKTASKKG